MLGVEHPEIILKIGIWPGKNNGHLLQSMLKLQWHKWCHSYLKCRILRQYWQVLVGYYNPLNMIPWEPISGFKNSGIWPGIRYGHPCMNKFHNCYWVPVTGPNEEKVWISFISNCHKFSGSIQFDSANFLVELAVLQEVYLHDNDSINKHQCCSIEHIMLCHRSWCPFERQGNSLP